MSGHRIVAAGDAALVVEFEERIDPAIAARGAALADALDAAHVPGVRDIVPTYRSVAVYFDPLRTDETTLVQAIERVMRQPAALQRAARPAIEIPVCYGGDFGPDLASVAAF